MAIRRLSIHTQHSSIKSVANTTTNSAGNCFSVAFLRAAYLRAAFLRAALVRSALALVVLMSVIAFVPPSMALADWPAFRGPSRDGITQLPLPTRWNSDSDNVRWRTEIPGQGWSSPVVVGSRIFLTAAVPQEQDAEQASYDLTLIGLNAASGEIEFQSVLFKQPADSPRIHKKNSHASPTPVFDGERLFVHFGHQGTACVTLAGETIWKNTDLDYPPVHGNGGSPAVVGDLVLFSRDGSDVAEVTALNKASGKLVWQTKRDVEASKRFSFATPLVTEVNGQTQIIVPGSNVVQSLNPATGEEYWRLRYDGYSVIPRPIIESGLVFVCTGYNRPVLLAIDPTGSGDVTDTHLKWQSKENIPHTPSLVGYQGKIAAVSDNGIAVGFDAVSGEQLWRERIGGNFSASPILSGDLLYLLSEQGDCTVLDLSDERREVAVNKLGERCLASMAVVDQDLLIRSDAALYRIGHN